MPRTSKQPLRKDAIRIQRVQQIKERLINLGWGEEVAYVPGQLDRQLDKHKLVSRAEKLSERMWKRVLPMLEEHLKEVRKQRLEYLSLQKFLKHWKAFLEFYAKFSQKAAIFPLPTEFVLFKSFQALLLETPASEHLTGQDFETVQDGIKKFYAQWKLVKQKQLLGMVLGRPVMEEDMENLEAILNSATTGFTCGHCPTYPTTITYPEILQHRHATHPDAFEYDDRFPAYLRPGFNYVCGYTCNEVYLHRIIYHPSYKQAATMAIKQCGLDSELATVQDMECIGAVVVVPNDADPMVLDWRSAIEYYLEDL